MQKIRTINRSHTKSGPGRYHGQCNLITDMQGTVIGVRKPVGKLRTENYGGNWQGISYLSMREHDLATRLTFPQPGQMHRQEAEDHVKSLRPTR